MKLHLRFTEGRCYSGYLVRAKITFVRATFVKDPEYQDFNSILSNFGDETCVDTASPLCINFINFAQRSHNI
jgi:hypothetical protein